MAQRTKKKRKKSKSLMMFLTVMMILALAIAGLLAGSLYGFVESTSLIDVENMRLNLTSFVYAEDPETGNMVEVERLYDTENRIWVPGSKIPEHLKNAFVSIEDERFYSHSGFDIKRSLGAAIQFITKKGESSYGGSTITQQLIKNLTQDDDYSVKRKIKEIYRAYNLEKELSKDEILEYYLNTIYLSQQCNGVGSAANTYFGKDVSKLSLAESASLAGITKFPTKYDPLINPENNKQRQLVILKKMYDLGFITSGEYEAAKKEKLVFKKKTPEQTSRIQSYYTDAAIDQIINDLMKKYNYTREFAGKVLYNGGLKIYLAMDVGIQEKLDTVFNDPSTFQKSSAQTQPQSSMVIMDPYTGHIKALIGGRGKKDANRTLNRATQSQRQPGSTIKPLSVYSPAIEYGLVTPSSIVNDSPISFGDWKPRNDDKSFAGSITVRAALRGSRNVPAVKICNYLTPEASFDFVKNNYHVSGLVKSDKRNGKVFSDVGLASIALGGLTDGVSVLDMCAAYCVFPNGGKYIQPATYTKVVDSNGKVILEHKKQSQVAISETTAREMVSMLTDVVTGGTGTAARLSNMRAAGKTGTTSSNNDRWFVGFTPYYVGAVWFGYDEPTPLKGFSPNPAAVAWRKVMNEVHSGLKDKPFFSELNSSERMVMVCAESGMRVTPSCTKLTSKKFKLSQIPSKTCTEHKYKFNKNDLDEGGNIIKKNTVVQGTVEDIFSEEGGTSSEGTETAVTSSPQTGTVLDSPETEKSQNKAPAPPKEERTEIDGI